MNIKFQPNATQVETIRTLLKGAERVSNIAKKSGLVSQDSDHTTFMTHELERLRALGFVERVSNNKKSIIIILFFPNYDFLTDGRDCSPG